MRFKNYKQTWVMIPAPVWDGILLIMLVSGVINILIGFGVL